MDLPKLNAEAAEALHRARTHSAERDVASADLADILIELLDSPGAVQVLDLFEAETDKVRTALTFLTQGGVWSPDSDAELRTVDLAQIEASRLGQHETGSEHLLLGLLRQPGSLGSGLLESLGVTLGPAREAARFIHGQLPDWKPPSGDRSSALASMVLPGYGVPQGNDLDEMGDMAHRALMHLEAGLSPLRAVIGIGLGVEAAGVLVELIALEIRAAGAILSWRTQTEEDRLLGSPDMTIVDDLGTRYEVFTGSWGGGGRESRGQTYLVPSPPGPTRVLTIEVHSFNRDGPPVPLHVPMEPVSGPWRFEVPLAE